ncbi:MAG: hypothetical protein FD544_000112 [Pelagibacterales bacterium]|mgnify:FL=1|jgi:exonuclease VII small subunit|nr:hypothetical protein [Pelagibacterales bacterium]
MKTEIILDESKSKSIKEIKEKIHTILDKLESKNVNLSESIEDYKKLIELNKEMDSLFKKKIKEISLIGKIDK